MHLPWLPSRWVSLCVPGVIKGNEDAGLIQDFIFFISGVKQGNEGGGVSSRFPSVTQEGRGW